MSDIEHEHEEEEQEEMATEDAIKEFLANGGKITQCPPGQRTENLVISQWGRPGSKKKAEALAQARKDEEDKLAGRR